MAVTSPIVSVNYLHYRAMNPATSRLSGSQWEFSLMVMDRRDLACKLIQVYSLLICPIPHQPNGLHFSPWLGLSVPLGYIKSPCGRGSSPHLWKREASEGLLGPLKRITASLCWPCFHQKNPVKSWGQVQDSIPNTSLSILPETALELGWKSFFQKAKNWTWNKFCHGFDQSPVLGTLICLPSSAMSIASQKIGGVIVCL